MSDSITLTRKLNKKNIHCYLIVKKILFSDPVAHDYAIMLKR